MTTAVDYHQWQQHIMHGWEPPETMAESEAADLRRFALIMATFGDEKGEIRASDEHIAERWDSVATVCDKDLIAVLNDRWPKP